MKLYNKVLIVAMLSASLSSTINAAAGSMQKEMSLEEAVETVEARMCDVLQGMVKKHPCYSCSILKPVARYDWLPGYIIKSNCLRLRGADILKSCIEEHGLHLLSVPSHALVTCKAKVPEPTSEDLWWNVWLPASMCVAEYIEGDHEGKMTLEQTRQMVVLLTEAEKTFVEGHKTNFVHTSDGKLSIIDTEMRGFLSKDIVSHAPQAALCFLYTQNEFEPEAEEYLRAEILERYGIELKEK